MTARAASPHHVVSASAGTGKTYLLAVQYLGLLYRGAPPEGIVATTFTRKAAGEILARVLSRLAGAALGSDPDKLRKLSEDLQVKLDVARCRQMLAALARNLHRLAIGTIDSFFHRTVRAFSLQLGVSPAVRVVAEDDPLAQRLRWQALEAVLGDGDLPQLLTLLRQLLKDSAGHDLAAALDATVRDFYEVFQESPQPEAWTALEVPHGGMGRIDLASALEGLAVAIGKNTDDALAPPLQSNYQAAIGLDWSEFLKKGLAKKILEGGERPITFGRAKTVIPDDMVAALEPLVNHAKAALVEQVARCSQGAWALLSRFDEHYRRLRRQHHLLLFSDLTHLLARAALEIDELYYRLDARVRHLLLDEFQDTSRLQWRVLRPLAQEVTAHGDGERSFFCVGDPKQAIYAWRGGCAGLFDELRRQLPLPAQAFRRLDTSYRSSPVVLEVVNTVFRGLPDNPVLEDFPQLAQVWGENFPEHKAYHGDRPGHVVLKTLCAQEESDDGADDDGGDDEAAAPSGFLTKVAQYVGRLARTHPEHSVGVLLRRNKNLNRLIYLLRRLGLAVSGEGGTPLSDDSAVNLVLSALRLADYPGDAPSAFHVLNSPLAPFLKLRGLDRRHVGSVALALRRRLIDDGYAAVIHDWARVLAPYLDRRNAERLAQLVALADAYDTEPSLRPDLFARLVRQTRLEEPTPTAVRVMTIHGAKGLEFDVVVLPELEEPLSRGKFAHLVQRDEHGQPQAVFAAAAKEICELSPQLKQAYATAQAQQVQDELCALYVGMTRARYALHLLIKPLGKREHGGITPDRQCPANILRFALGPDDEAELQERVLFESGDAQWHRHETVAPKKTPPQPAEPVRVRIKTMTAPAPAGRSWRRVTPSSLEDGGRVSVQRLVLADESSALRRGSLLHHWLRLIEWIDGDPRPTDEQLRAAARDVGWIEADPLNQAIADFGRILELPAVRGALSRPAGEVEVWRERSFAVRVEHDLFTGAFDRVVLHKRQGRVDRVELWDFKTDRVNTENMQAVTERYRPQLAAYRQALAVLLDLPTNAITARLLFLTTGQTWELPVTPAAEA